MEWDGGELVSNAYLFGCNLRRNWTLRGCANVNTLCNFFHMLSSCFKLFLFSALWILSILLLSFSEEIRFTTLLHLVVIWINIRAVSSAVWEHNASLWFWTKTPSSNDSGLLLLAHVGLVMLYFAEWIHSPCCLYFYSFSWASSTSVTQTLVCHFHMFAVTGGDRDRKERIISQFDKSLLV